MKIVKVRDIAPTHFDNEVAKGVSGRVAIGKADGAPNFCMRMFELAPGGNTPRHAHAWEHEIFFHAGNGEVFHAGTWTPVEPGVAVFVPGDEEHQIRNTGDAPLTFICLVPAGVQEL